MPVKSENEPAAALPRSDSHRPRGEVRPSKRGRWRAIVLIGVHVVAALHIWHWLSSGSSLSPLEPSESGETLVTGAINAGFVFFVLLLLSTLVLGRFFCGWACHLVALQDLCAWLLGKLGLRPNPVRSRLLMLVPLLAAVEMFVLPSLLGPDAEHGGAWQGVSVELTTETFWARFPGLGIALLTFLVDGFLIVWWLGAKAFCTYGCPYGALFGLADRVAPGRIRVNDACEGCGHCTATCTSNVRVHEEVARYGMVVDPGCMKCLDCVSVCPKGALSFGFGPSRSSALKQAKARPARRYDLTWPEEILAALLFGGALFATRNLYQLVPFLLALGLSVLVAIAGVAGLRLVRRRNFRFQHAVLREDGRWTARGGIALLGIAAVLALTAHSGLVRFHTRSGENELEEAVRLAPGSPARAAGIEASLAHLLRAEELALIDTAPVQNQLGQIRSSKREFADAEHHFRLALELDPSMLVPRLQLADIALLEGRAADALAPLAEVLERAPTHPGAAARLTRIIGAEPELYDAHVLLARTLLAAGDVDNARSGLAWVLERAPAHPAALRLQDELAREPQAP